MPLPLTAYKLFIATPGGLQDERRIFRETIQDYNETDAVQRGVIFIPHGWEDTLGGTGRPQALINCDISNCDCFVLCLWDRWGTPTRSTSMAGTKYTSGVQEEYEVALKCQASRKQPMRHIVALFKAVDPSKLSDPGDQLKKVLEFKRDLEISKKILFKTFDETSEFQKTLRSHLANWVREHEQERGEPKRISEVAPSGSSLSAIDAVQLSEDPIANPLVKKAENLARQGRLTDAEVAFAKAIATGDDPDACNRYGVFLHRMGRLKQAELMYERVLNLGGRGSPKWKAIGYSNLGRVYAERGELDRAVDMHRRSLTLEKRLGRDKGIVLSHINIGVTFLTRSDEEQAARWLNKALKLARGKNYEEGVAYALLNLAAVDIERKDFPRAQQRLKEVISLAKRLGDPDLSPSALAALAEVSFHENKHQEAEALLRRALKIGEKSGDQEALAHVHWLFGKIHLSRNDIEGAGHSLDLALEIADRLGSPDIIAGILVDISRFYHEQKKDDFARAAVMKALQYYGVLGDRKKTDELKPWLDKLTAAVLAPGAPKES